MSGKPDIGAGTVRTHRLPGNLVVKSLVTVMVAITGLGVLPWRLVVIWTAFLVLAAGLEEWLLRLDVKQQLGPLGKLVAPWPRIAISALCTGRMAADQPWRRRA